MTILEALENDLLGSGSQKKPEELRRPFSRNSSIHFLAQCKNQSSKNILSFSNFGGFSIFSSFSYQHCELVFFFGGSATMCSPSHHLSFFSIFKDSNFFKFENSLEYFDIFWASSPLPSMLWNIREEIRILHFLYPGYSSKSNIFRAEIFNLSSFVRFIGLLSFPFHMASSLPIVFVISFISIDSNFVDFKNTP